MAAALPNQAPPIVHAVAGSLGSALAVFLFYPLERARIELQAQASASTSTSTVAAEVEAESVDVELHIEQQQHHHHQDDDQGEADPSFSWTHADSPSASSVSDSERPHPELSSSTATATASSSWEMENATTRTQSSIAAEEAGSPTTIDCDATTTQQPPPPRRTLSQKNNSNNNNNKKQQHLGLMECLLRLHAEGDLYKGVTPVVTTIFTSQFVFFFMHAYVKRVMREGLQRTTNTHNNRHHSQQQQQQQQRYKGKGGNASISPLQSLLSSCLAGIGNVLLTNPLWVVNMAIVTGQTQSNSLFRELVTMIQARGFKYLWNGTSASLLLVSNPVIQFFCYERFKLSLLERPDGLKGQRNVLRPSEAFLTGALAKAVATITTYPLQLTQTVLRLKDNGYSGIVDCLLQLFQRGGIPEWFRGMRAKLLQTVLTAAFTFLTYEQLLGVVQKVLVQRATSRAEQAAAVAAKGPRKRR